MSLPTRLTGIGAEATMLRDQAPKNGAKHLALREIEVRFAAAMVESALPKSASFGKGVSGNIARGHLVERIANVLADSNALGIARAAEMGRNDMAPRGPGDRQQER